MSVMATPADAMPAGAPGEPFTVEDLEAMPEDGRRYELIDGMLLVSPAPNVAHQEVVLSLAILLRQACPRDLMVLIAPFEWRIGEHTSVRPDRTAVQPDVLVARRKDIFAVEGLKHLLEPPVLAVEVLSPSSRRIDRLTKLSVYQDEEVQSYWLIDSDPDEPSLTVLEFADGRYQEVARLTGEEHWTAGSPFPVDLCPADLVAELRA